MPSAAPHRIVVIVGPTAGGKSELAARLGEQCRGEIINADSMQVYRYLDAGTAKPTADQLRRVPHHMVDIVEPTESWTVADWLEAAERTIDELHRRRRLPIVVGGTNLYLKALLEGMFDAPPADPAFRQPLADVSSHELHERLTAIDPEAADRIHRNDHKRIVRALEVHHLTGKPISEQQGQWGRHEGTKARRHEVEDLKSQISDFRYRHDPILIGLDWPTEAINRRINARVKAMFDPAACGLAGHDDLVSETRRLDAAGLLGDQAREALGTKQVLAHLAGEMSLDEAIERTKIDTRRFAKQQRTWLKRYRGVHWLKADEHDMDELAAQTAAIVTQAVATPDSSAAQVRISNASNPDLRCAAVRRG